MRVTLRGTRGSLPTPGPYTHRYGGNTSCVEVHTTGGGLIVLDAGTGIRQVGVSPAVYERVDVLLTHLHMDHILGLGFFGALFCPDLAVHIWGPASTTLDLRQRLARYLSPPLFPVVLRDLPCRLELHDLPSGPFTLPTADVSADLVCHPGPTAGIRISDGTGTMCYLPDHEPALGARRFPGQRHWTSGIGLAAGVDLLIHDAQYTDSEYEAHVGWGHSSLDHAMAMAEHRDGGTELSGHGRQFGLHIHVRSEVDEASVTVELPRGHDAVDIQQLAQAGHRRSPSLDGCRNTKRPPSSTPQYAATGHGGRFNRVDEYTEHSHRGARAVVRHPEVRAALAAAHRSNDLDREALGQAEHSWDEFWAATRPVELTQDVGRHAGEIAKEHSLRAADAVHLASALAMCDPSLILAVWDRRLHAGALAARLGVAPVTLDPT